MPGDRAVLNRPGRFAVLMFAAMLSGTAARAEDGADLFREHCGACHQPDGGGTPGLAPPLKGAHFGKLLAERSYLPRVLAFGMTGQIRSGDAPFNGAMPAQTQLDDTRAAAVANHVAGELNAGILPAGWHPYDAAEILAP
jgi:mono/diheme cytochrome c family protein